MPLATVKLFSATKVSALNTAVAAYKAGSGSELASKQRAEAADMIKDAAGNARMYLALAHGGLNVPVSKTADLQHVTVQADGNLARLQAAVDDHLAHALHATDTTGDTTVAGKVTVTSTTFFASEDVGRLMTVDGVEKTITAIGDNAVAATGTLTTVRGSLLTDGDNFIVDDGVNAPVTFEFDDDASVVETATLRAVAFVAGAAATGSLTALATASLADGDVVTLDDGVNPAVTFEFDVTGTHSPAPGNVEIDISALVTDIQVADAIRTAIGGVTLDITPDAPGTALIDLVNDAVGVMGNVAITETLASGTLSPVGMTGGVDDTSADDLRDAIVAAFAGAPTLDITASDGGAATVDLVNDLPGAGGNVAIVDNVTPAGFVIAGMAGGVNATTTSAFYAGTALVSGTGKTVKLFGAEVIQSLYLSTVLDRDRDTNMLLVIACEGQVA